MTTDWTGPSGADGRIQTRTVGDLVSYLEERLGGGATTPATPGPPKPAAAATPARPAPSAKSRTGQARAGDKRSPKRSRT